jgi:hypothetical protein
MGEHRWVLAYIHQPGSLSLHKRTFHVMESQACLIAAAPGAAIA